VGGEKIIFFASTTWPRFVLPCVARIDGSPATTSLELFFLKERHEHILDGVVQSNPVAAGIGCSVASVGICKGGCACSCCRGGRGHRG